MTLPYRPSAVIFDMDGLLFDTEALGTRPFFLLLPKVGTRSRTNLSAVDRCATS
jgi:beta-phosphoglucomutase-like phosphatase (HAD superfamily)